MAFEPDILVQTADGTTLVIEVKARPISKDASATLKQYMSGMRIPLGMLVSPGTISLYRDTYRGTGEDSIREIGTYPVQGIEALTPSVSTNEARAGLLFEAAVQSWLETLAAGAPTAGLPPALRDAFEQHVLPILRDGQVRAAGPRKHSQSLNP